jgi:hypothetical protein
MSLSRSDEVPSLWSDSPAQTLSVAIAMPLRSWTNSFGHGNNDVQRSRISEDQLERCAEAEAKE